MSFVVIHCKERGCKGKVAFKAAKSHLAYIRKFRRLKGCKRDVDIWQRILKVRALVATPLEDTEIWVKFANLCRKSGRLGLAEKTINSLLNDAKLGSQVSPLLRLDRVKTYRLVIFQSSEGPPIVIYAHLKYLWATGAREETLTFLKEFTGRIGAEIGLTAQTDMAAFPDQSKDGKLPLSTRLISRCYYKLGEWQTAMQTDWGSVSTVRLQSLQILIIL